MDDELKRKLLKHRLRAYSNFDELKWKTNVMWTMVLNKWFSIADCFDTLLIDIVEVRNNEGLPVPVNVWTVGYSQGIVEVATNWATLGESQKSILLNRRRFKRYTGGLDPHWPTQLNEKH
jgi:hypothetical protein